MLPSLKNCPDCGSSLGKTAFKCRCGWKGTAYAEPVRLISCAHDGCNSGAICSVRTNTGRANLCKAHYSAHWSVDTLRSMVLGKPSTQHMEEVRRAYLKSYAYRHRDDYAIVPQAPERKAA